MPEIVVPTVLSAPTHLPSYASHGDAGADLRAAEAATLSPLQRMLISTGVSLALPHGTVGLIHPRSGLAAKKGVTVLNAPGTIDAGYRGEIKVILVNLSDTTVEIEQGERIAQLVIQDVHKATFEVADTLPESIRGDGGFGSTGRH